ncbi:hypothetical protein J1N35_011899 [Gossypium stocksii]|uniref:RNase H type-1 domain-containing protein n=1 Tax=Gossypium stocksii TaxID=47602 RepID=A0A9D3W394_9ROSI|nr:hypothetical protein J1N35_011899 [Gossypium stocksii]
MGWACASVGGAIRDTNRVWQCGFSMTIGEGTMFQEEARPVLEELRLALDKGFRKLKFECDNTTLVEIILAGGAVDSRLTELILIHNMLI